MVVQGALVLCKWQRELTPALLERKPDTYLVLDAWDVQFGGVDPDVLRRFPGVYQVSSFDSLEELAAVAADLDQRGVTVGQVLSFTEFSQFGAGYLELLFGIVADPLRHVGHRDKRLMKKRVRAAGVPTAEFASLPDPADTSAVATVGVRFTGPMVVKPATGFGTMSTLRVDDADALRAAVADFEYQPMLRGRQLIVEEYVPGTEMMIDALWADGQPLTFVAHAYPQPRLTVAESVDPVGLDGSRVLPETEHAELYDRLREMHGRINEALGIRHGATHLEVFRRDDGELVFSEIGTRIGGGWCADLLTAHLECSIWELLADVTAYGSFPAPKSSHLVTGAVHIKPQAPGVIDRIPEDGELAAFPGVVTWRRFRNVGDRVHLAHPSEWCLFVVLAADTTAEYEALCDEVAHRFAIGTVPA